MNEPYISSAELPCEGWLKFFLPDPKELESEEKKSAT